MDVRPATIRPSGTSGVSGAGQWRDWPHDWRWAGPCFMLQRPPSPSEPRDGTTGATDWPSTNYDQSANRYSPLTQITAANVSTLQQVWSVHLKPAGFVGRLREDEAIPHRDRQHDVSRLAVRRDPSRWMRPPARRNGNFSFPTTTRRPSAALAYWPGGGGAIPLPPSIIFGTATGGLYSLKASDGTPNEWFGENGVTTLKTPEVMQTGMNAAYSLLSSPTIYKDLIITGAGTGEGPGGSNAGAGPAGDTRAWDARTGKLVWTFHTVPRPGEFGYDTWGERQREEPIRRQRLGLHVARRGARHSLHAARRSEQRSRRHRSSRQQPVLVVGRRGRREHRQVSLALPARAPRHLGLRHRSRRRCSSTCAGTAQIVPAVIIVNKTGLMFTLNRVTGKPIFDIEERPVPKSDVPGEQASPTQPFPVKPEPLTQNTIAAEQSLQGRAAAPVVLRAHGRRQQHEARRAVHADRLQPVQHFAAGSGRRDQLLGTVLRSRAASVHFEHQQHVSADAPRFSGPDGSYVNSGPLAGHSPVRRSRPAVCCAGRRRGASWSR